MFFFLSEYSRFLFKGLEESRAGYNHRCLFRPLYYEVTMYIAIPRGKDPGPPKVTP